MSNFRIKCPYCDEYNEYNFKICKQYSNYRKVKCDKCNLQFEISVNCKISCSADSEELKKVIPKDKVEMVKNICSKYLKYSGKGGYENSRDIKINSNIEEKIINWNNENCYCISLGGRANYYESEFRSVCFYIYPSGKIEQECMSTYNWKQNYWFKGDTIEEKIDNYIQNVLIKWKTI